MNKRATRVWFLSVVLLVSLAARAQDLPRWRQVPDLSARVYAAMAYDEARDRAVMFGGTPRYTGVSTNLGDTWEWDGTRWRARSPEHRPEPRYGAGMAYCPHRQRVVLFGGMRIENRQLLRDFWEWDGEDWRRIPHATSPEGRLAPAFALDPARGRIVMFGGLILSPTLGWTPTDETWEWDGVDWRQMAPANRPSPRYFCGLAYCARSGALVTYGGGGPGGSSIGDRTTWEWDGVDWRATPGYPGWPATTGVARHGYGVAALPWSGTALFFCGNLVSRRAESWEWDGQSWNLLDLVTGSSGGGINARGGTAFCLDTARQQVVLFSGHTNLALMHRDTWTFDHTHRWQKAHESFQLWTPYQAVQYDPARDEYIFLQQDTSQLARPMRTFRMPGAGMESEMEEVPGTTLVPGRVFPGFCYDPVSRKLLLFGGEFNAARLSDTWLWDGTDWTEPTYAVHPPPGLGAPVYDSSRRAIVMPVITSGQRLETWQWTEARGWTQMPHPPAAPHAHDHVFAAHDPLTNEIVALIWQWPPGQRPAVHTWTFDGSTWTEAAVTRSPPLFLNALLYVPELGGVVAIVNQDDYPQDPHQIWRWDQGDWTRVPVGNRPGGERVWNPASPYPRVFVGKPVYDSSRGKVRLFQFRGPGWFCEDLLVDRLSVNTTGPGLGSTWTATIRDASQAGNLFALALSGSEWPGLPLRWRPELGAWERFPLGDDPLLRASAAAGLGTGVLDASGIGSFSLTIPTDPQLVGYRFHAAAVTLAPRGPALGVVTNPVTMEIQR